MGGDRPQSLDSKGLLAVKPLEDGRESIEGWPTITQAVALAMVSPRSPWRNERLRPNHAKVPRPPIAVA